jgi:hypothetical protein
MLHPILILCVVVWFVAAIYLWAALDQYMLDRDEQGLRGSVAAYKENGLDKLAALAQSEVTPYPRAVWAAAITALLAAAAVTSGVLLAFPSWRAGLSPLSRGAAGATLAYVAFLTLQAWVTVHEGSTVAWVCADYLLAAGTLATLLAAGVRENQL